MTLYHYTDIEAVKNILQKNVLWLTHIRFMNDGEELSKGIHYILKKTNDLLANDYGVSKLDILDREIIHSLQEYQIYTCSFCTASNDLLSQWRGYGNYCIEFDEAVLLEYCNGINSGLKAEDKPELGRCDLKECSYDTKKNKVSGSTLAQKMYENNQGIVKTMRKEATHKIVRTPHDGLQVHNEIVLLASSWKDPGFREEEESRLIAQVNPQERNSEIKYRTRGGMLIPYYELPLPENCIKSINIGPHKEQALAKESLEMYIEKLSFHDRDCPINHQNKPVVTTSDIPFKP